MKKSLVLSGLLLSIVLTLILPTSLKANPPGIGWLNFQVLVIDCFGFPVGGQRLIAWIEDAAGVQVGGNITIDTAEYDDEDPLSWGGAWFPNDLPPGDYFVGVRDDFGFLSLKKISSAPKLPIIFPKAKGDLRL